MKRLMLLAVLVLGVISINAQDVKTAKKLLDAKDFAKAKDAIDQALATDKGAKDWEAWYVKAKIYSGLAANEATKTLVSDARLAALDAVKKALEVNNGLTTLALAQESYKPVFSLYEGYYGEGAASFNAEKYEDAFNSYKNANVVGEYINKNGWALTALDTGLVFMIGASANNARKLDDAAVYYAKLVDAQVPNKDYLIAYRFVAYYYSEKKDEAAFNKYLAMGKKMFPDEKYFDDLEIDYLDKKGDKNAVLAKYEEIMAKNTNDFDTHFNFGVTIFNMVYNADTKPANAAALTEKMEKAFVRCTEIRPDEVDSYIELGKSHYNQAVEFKAQEDAVKGKTPADITNKKDLHTKAEKKINDAIPYFEKGFAILEPIPDKKPGQKAKTKSTAQLLRDCYNFINKTDKAKMYDDKVGKM
jgi:tetratricopeptide (TPR) repeat protein